MENCFYILARNSVFLNKKFVRVLETRVFHRFGTNTLIRNFCVKQSSIQEISDNGLRVLFGNPSLNEEVYSRLSLVTSFDDEIIIK